MIAQFILTILLAGILLYAWTEYRRSPVVALLTLFVAGAELPPALMIVLLAMLPQAKFTIVTTPQPIFASASGCRARSSARSATSAW